MQPVVLINVFTPKPGKLDPLIRYQADDLRDLWHAGRFPGWLGSRWHRAIDADRAANVTAYESMDAYNRLKEEPELAKRFSEHLRRIGPLVERVEGGFYSVVESVGQV
jgi:hypothetical protein